MSGHRENWRAREDGELVQLLLGVEAEVLLQNALVLEPLCASMVRSVDRNAPVVMHNRRVRVICQHKFSLCVRKSQDNIQSLEVPCPI
jgi:hypothetical protein